MRYAAAVFLSMILSVAVLNAGESSQQSAAYGGTLVWGASYKPTVINPILTTHSVSASLQGLIFNELIRLNAKGEIEPDLAESWEISEDGLIYTFHLRKGVKFHDGVECTAEDVKFTFDKIIDKQTGSPFRSFFNLVSEFKATDKYTFQAVLSKPAPSMIYRFIRPIAPRHLLENGDIRTSSFNTRPVGTGPFKLKEWDKDNQIVLEYNPDYYEGRPYLDKIIVRAYADSRQLWAALMRQEADLAMFIEKNDYGVIRSDPAFKGYAFPVNYYYAISYNPQDPILSDLKVREAVAYGVNRKSLIEKMESGYGLECAGPFYPGSIGFNPQVEPIEFDPAKAAQLLAEAGWQDLNKDGIREKEGRDLEIRMLVDERNISYHKISMLLRQQLQEIGIKLVVQLYNDESMINKDFLEKNESSACLVSIMADADPDQMAAEWSSQGAGKNYSLWAYSDPDVDRYFNLGMTVQDKKKRQWIYQEIHRFIYADQPACFLYFPFHFHAVSSKFTNTDELFSLGMPYGTMRKWSRNKK